MSRIIVVGGGASGLMAAGAAAEAGARVLLIEKTKKLGSKLRLTGNRHCNLAHQGDLQDQVEHYVGEPRFARNVLARFGVDDLCWFIDSLGVPVVTDPDGRIFPRSRNAHEVASALRRHCLESGVVFRYGSPAHEIMLHAGPDKKVRAVRLADRELDADAVIVCTGGMSYPKTGSTGDGYRFAEALGHTVAPLRPGLVALYCQELLLQQAAGIVLEDVRGSIVADGRQAQCASRGDLLVTHQGFSGPLAFGLSTRLGAVGQSLTIELDLLPDINLEAIDRQLLDLIEGLHRAQYAHLLRRLIPEKLVPLFCARVGVLPTHRLSQLSAAQRSRTTRTLKRLTFDLSGTAPFGQAMVTVGGIACDEVDSRTMASKLVDGLYWAGELLDVTGADTGGYNLQLAFATGYLAGVAAAEWVANRV